MRERRSCLIESRRGLKEAFPPLLRPVFRGSKSGFLRQCAEFLRGICQNTALQEAKKQKEKSPEFVGISRLFCTQAADRI